MSHFTSLSLRVRGKPSAWDISNDACVVSSPGCLTFFNLYNLGTPRHVIHYEQPQQVRQVRFQKNGGYVAALRAGVVSLWDPAKSLRPLLGLIQYDIAQNIYITDMQWCAANSNILATGCDNGGEVSIWDIRTPNISVQSTQQMPGSICHCLEWCNTNSYYLAAANGKSLLVWDTRMVPTKYELDSPRKEGCVFLENFDAGINQFAWTQFSGSPAIVSKSNIDTLELWSMSPNLGDVINKELTTECDNIDTVLATPDNSGVIILRSGKNLEKNNKDTEQISYSIDLCQFHSSSVDKTKKNYLSKFSKIANSDEFIIGMKWGSRGQSLISPGDSNDGNELLFLTESSILFSVKLMSKSQRQLALYSTYEKDGKEATIQKEISDTSNKIIATPKYSLNSLNKSIKNTGFVTDTFSQPNYISKTIAGASKNINMTNSVWDILNEDILSLEEMLANGDLEHLSIGSIDKGKNQVTLLMTKIHIFSDNKVTNGSVVLQLTFRENALDIASINIIVPDESTARILPPAFTELLEVELVSVAASIKNSTKSLVNSMSATSDASFMRNDTMISTASTESDLGLLVKLARSFRHRVLQYLCKKLESIPSNKVSISSYINAGGVDVDNDRTLAASDDLLIDQSAYKVPCPISSGARFCANGPLLFFGGAELYLKDISTIQNQEQMKFKYPKSFADFMIAEHKKQEDVIHQFHSPRNVGDNEEEIDIQSDDGSSGFIAYNKLDLVANLRNSNSMQNLSSSLKREGSVGSTFSLSSQVSQLSNLSDTNDARVDESHSGVISSDVSNSNYLSSKFNPLGEPFALEKLEENLDMIGELKNKKLQDSFLTSHLTSSKPSIIYAMDSFHKKFKYLAVNYALGPLYTTYDRKSHIEANYTLDGSRSCDVVMKGRSAMCRYNASITPEYSIKQLWNLLAVCLEFLSLNINEKEEGGFVWKESTLGQSLLRRIINFLIQVSDVQTLATVICLLGGSSDIMNLLVSDNFQKVTSDLYHDNLEFDKCIIPLHKAISFEYFERLLKSYATMLYNCGSLLKATEVSKYFYFTVDVINDLRNEFNNRDSFDDEQRSDSSNGSNESFYALSEINQSMEGNNIDSNVYICSVTSIGVNCYKCNKRAESTKGSAAWCQSCNSYALSCSICQDIIRGTALFCTACGHGGHPTHLKKWFELNAECPSGCDCRCLLRNFRSSTYDTNGSDIVVDTQNVSDDGDFFDRSLATGAISDDSDDLDYNDEL